MTAMNPTRMEWWTVTLPNGLSLHSFSEAGLTWVHGEGAALKFPSMEFVRQAVEQTASEVTVWHHTKEAVSMTGEEDKGS